MKKRILCGVLSLMLMMVLGCETAPAAEVAPVEEPEEEVFAEVELPVVELIIEPKPEEPDEPEVFDPTWDYVAFTFDDGPVPTTETLLDGLAERDVKATFFCLGIQANKYPDTIRRIVDEGHQLANHSYSHLNMTKVTTEEWQADFQKAEDTFNTILGRDADVTYWLRPPYGIINRSQYSSVDVPMVMWSVDPRDWDLQDTQAVVEAVLATVEPYDIILFHDTYATSVEAALEVIDRLSAMGYHFVTVEELLAYREIEAEAGVIYRAATGKSDAIWYGSDYVKSE